jgi:hypothetical protein
MDWAAAKDKVVSISGTDTLNHAFQLMFTQVRTRPSRSPPPWHIHTCVDHAL